MIRNNRLLQQLTDALPWLLLPRCIWEAKRGLEKEWRWQWNKTYTHAHTSLPSPKTLTGTSSTIHKLNSSSRPMSICVSMHALKRLWRCTHRLLLTTSESSNPCRYKLSYMEVWYSQVINLTIKCKCGIRKLQREYVYPLAHNKTTEGGMSSRWQSPLSLLKPVYCINEDEVWSITS